SSKTLAPCHICLSLEHLMKVPGTDHVQLAMSKGSEDRVRGFYSKVLGMKETTKPQALAGRRGCWFASGAAQVHLGVEIGRASCREGGGRGGGGGRGWRH